MSSRLSKAKNNNSTTQRVDSTEYNTKQKQVSNIDYANDTMREKEQTTQQSILIKKDKPKRKPGRPKVKKEEETIINIAVPISVYEQMTVAKSCYGGNLTKYVNSVIIKDLQENYSKYSEINNTLNGFNNN